MLRSERSLNSKDCLLRKINLTGYKILSKADGRKIDHGKLCTIRAPLYLSRGLYIFTHFWKNISLFSRRFFHTYVCLVLKSGFYSRAGHDSTRMLFNIQIWSLPNRCITYRGIRGKSDLFSHLIWQIRTT